MLRTTPTTNHSPQATRGLTLVEMLISMAVTLIMMAAVVNLFANIGAGVKTRNASMALGTQLRLARARLFKDLAGATSAVRPKLPSDDHEDGYLEIIEGPAWSDSYPSVLTDGVDDGPGSGPGFLNLELDYATSAVPSSNLPLVGPNVTDGGALGDHDCVLALTVRSESEPFVGRWVDAAGNPQTIESDLAEILWYVVEHPMDGSLGEPGMRTLYRRVLLIAPWVELPTLNSLPGANTEEKILSYYRNYDVSAQIYQVEPNGDLFADPTIPLAPNTLSDLTKRENRFAHRWNNGWTATGWPYQLDQRVIRELPYTHTPPTVMIGPLRPFGQPFDPTMPPTGPDRKGEDVMLNDVLALDLRVFDPGAPLYDFNGVVLEPADAGWEAAIAAGATIVGYGAYVSLGWDLNAVYTAPAGAPTPLFKEIHHPGWHPRDPTGVGFGPDNFATYDTWPYHYETDGINQDGDVDVNGNPLIDEGTDGLDTDNANGVDDSFERETAPPYDTPLRGMQVKIRIYDRDSRQIREATITRNFVPQ